MENDKEENDMKWKQLTGADEMWISCETLNCPMHITDIHIYDPTTAHGGRVTQEDIVAFIEERIDALLMREKRIPDPLGFDYGFWVDDENFDINHHVRFHTLPPPADWNQLMQLSASIFEEGLDMTRPLWEMHFIWGLDNVEGFPPGCFAMLHKKHHGQFDGTSATYLKMQFHTLDPDATLKSSAPRATWTPERPPTPLQVIQRTYWNNLVVKPIKRLEFMAKTLPTVPKALEAAAEDFRRNPKVPQTRWSHTIPSPRRCVEARAFSLSDCQLLRKSVPGSTLNDIVLNIYAGAIRKYLMHHNELPDRPVRAMVPVSLRKEEEIGKGGNKVFNFLVNLDLSIADPLERMAKIHEETLIAKERLDNVGGRNMVECIEVAPYPAIDGTIKAAMRLKISDTMPGLYSGFSISNVPGSKVPLYFCGAKQLRMYSVGFLMDGQGMLLVAGSYCDDMVLTAASNPELMPDMPFFAQCMEDSYQEICGCCGVSPKSTSCVITEDVSSQARVPAAETNVEGLTIQAGEAARPEAAAEMAEVPAPKKARGAKKQQ